MKRMQSRRTVCYGIILGALGLSSLAEAADGVQYRLAYVAATKTYQLYMRPTATPAKSTVLAGAQVTIKAPRNFAVSSFTNMVGTWRSPGSITPSPRENPNVDYISFDLAAIADFGFQAGVEKLVFTFQSYMGCLGSVALMENTDPFNKLPNSASTNPGNHIAVLQLNNNVDGNDYLGTYGGAANCTATAAAK